MTRNIGHFFAFLAAGIIGISGMAGCGNENTATTSITSSAEDTLVNDVSASESDSSDSIQIGIFDMGTLYLMEAFNDRGYYKDNGANVEFTYFPVYSDAMSAFNTGNVDMICYAGSEAISPVLSGIDCKIIGVFDTSDGLDGIAAAKGINSVADLKGKTVATEIGSVDHMMLLYAVEKSGLQDTDINVVNMSAGDSVAALASGSIDAVSTWQPDLNLAAENGSIIYSTQEDPYLIADVFLIRSEVLDAQYDNAKAIVKTWYEHIEDYETNPDEFTKDAAAYGNLSEDEYKAIMDVTNLVSLDENKTWFEEGDENGHLNHLLENCCEFLYKQGLITEKLTDNQIEGMIDSRIIDELIAEEGE